MEFCERRGREMVNENGNYTVRRPEDTVPPEALEILQGVMDHGAAKGLTGWDKLPLDIHVKRAYLHILKHLERDNSEPHLDHAFCRLIFAAVMKRRSEDQ